MTVKLYWVSANKQSSVSMGTYGSEPEAEQAIPTMRDQMLAQCADDEQRDEIDSGTWEVVP